MNAHCISKEARTWHINNIIHAKAITVGKTTNTVRHILCSRVKFHQINKSGKMRSIRSKKKNRNKRKYLSFKYYVLCGCRMSKLH